MRSYLKKSEIEQLEKLMGLKHKPVKKIYKTTLIGKKYVHQRAIKYAFVDKNNEFQISFKITKNEWCIENTIGIMNIPLNWMEEFGKIFKDGLENK